MTESKTEVSPPNSRTLPDNNPGPSREHNAGLEIEIGERQDDHSLADDILHGAAEIAGFLFGDRGKRRKVYYLAEKSCLPFFRLGSILCARKSRLRSGIEDQERLSVGGRD